MTPVLSAALVALLAAYHTATTPIPPILRPLQVRLVDTSMHQADVRVELWTNLAHCLMPQPECAPDVMEETALSSLLSSQDQCVFMLTHTHARAQGLTCSRSLSMLVCLLRSCTGVVSLCERCVCRRVGPLALRIVCMCDFYHASLLAADTRRSVRV